MSRIVVYADCSNLYHTVKTQFSVFGSHLRDPIIARPNYTKYVEYIKENIGEPIYMKAYGAQETTEANTFIKALNNIGFKTYWKKAVIHRSDDPDKRDTCTADWDIGICIDIINNMDKFDTLILGTADGDFSPLVKLLVKAGKTVIIFACEPSHKLKKSATLVLNITKEQIQ